MTIDSRLHLTNAKGLFDPKLLAELYDHFIASEGRSRQIKELSEREQKAIERGESSDAMRMQERWYDVWRKLPSLPKTLEVLSPFTWVTYPVQVRHVRKVDHSVPWHQDIGYMKLLGDRGHKKVITCFVPVEPNPAKCTTIQFALDNQDKPDVIYDHTARDGFGAGLPEDQCTQRKHFDMARGDALVFGDYVLHRTYTPPGCEVERRSLEFRLIRPEGALPNKDYFDIKNQVFIKTDEQKKVVANG